MLIDAHVHIVGDGSSGSGCRLPPRGALRGLQARLMLRELGLPARLLRGGLDQAYAALLQTLLERSSLDAALIMAFDHAYDAKGGRIESPLPFVPNRYVLELAARYPRFLPAVSIHPARRDALEELEACLARGARAAKLLPSVQNIDCSDSRFAPYWQRLAEAGVPLVVHTGGELSLPLLDKRLADPRMLRVPLECGATVIAAHAATSSAYERGYLRELIEMFERFPRLFADISGMITPLRCRHLRTLLDADVASRLVHGSDLPIPVQPLWLALRGMISMRRYRELRRTANPLERDYRAKRALGFPEEVFQRFATLIPRG